MRKFVSPAVIALFLVQAGAAGQKIQPSKFSTEIIAGHSTHIHVTKDTIIVIDGTTFSYTVDTPEDQGLVSTKPTIKQLLREIHSKDGSAQQYQLTDKGGNPKNETPLLAGDHLIVTAENGKAVKTYNIITKPMAVGGQLYLKKNKITAHTNTDLTLFFTAGQRTPDATVKIILPPGIQVTSENTTVNIIGRGNVKLRDLATQSIGRTGSHYSYNKVGEAEIIKSANGTTVLLFKHLDLRPANGADLIIVIENVALNRAGKYLLSASYTTSQPAILTSAGTGTETATLTATATIADFERVIDKGLSYRETPDTYSKCSFTWGSVLHNTAVQIIQSADRGKTWSRSAAIIDPLKSMANISGLVPNKLYQFKLSVADGVYKGLSNPVYFFSGKMDTKSFGIVPDSAIDNTEKINEAIEYLSQAGGGTLAFSPGIYNVRTVYLKSNVYLYVEKGAIIKAIKGGNEPEAGWFSDKKYRSGLSPTDTGPYEDPENYMTKQDVGHHYFNNAMFFGERLDNIKIIGNGLITGNGNLVNGDNVMKNPAGNRTDKMFSFKLCTNLEIGGIRREDDLWYDSTKDEPYYINKDGSKDFAIDNMLHIDRSGHFALLATGTDNLYVHDTYFGKNNNSNSRDIYDFMACNNVTATNIYCKVTSDDIIKPGSDCSLGFTRPAAHCKVRNIIGDTNCNLFQIGSETADDIMDVHVDNIYVLGANKAGFSISTNDGAHIKDVHLNCGHTGLLHSRSKMWRTYTPFFISISNRGRILGADAARYKFDENGVKHDELLVTNVNIGMVENIILNGIDITEVYAGSSYGAKNERWKAYDGTQRRATPIIAGYKLPDAAVVESGLNFKLPNDMHTGYVRNIVFNDVHVLVKGGNPASDTSAIPPELGVGQYNASNLKTEPSWAIWARHVAGLTVKNSSFFYEQTDNRFPFFLDDVTGATISNIKLAKPKEVEIVKLKNSTGINIENMGN